MLPRRRNETNYPLKHFLQGNTRLLNKVRDAVKAIQFLDSLAKIVRSPSQLLHRPLAHAGFSFQFFVSFR